MRTFISMPDGKYKAEQVDDTNCILRLNDEGLTQSLGFIPIELVDGSIDWKETTETPDFALRSMQELFESFNPNK